MVVVARLCQLFDEVQWAHETNGQQKEDIFLPFVFRNAELAGDDFSRWNIKEGSFENKN